MLAFRDCLELSILNCNVVVQIADVELTYSCAEHCAHRLLSQGTEKGMATEPGLGGFGVCIYLHGEGEGTSWIPRLWPPVFEQVQICSAFFAHTCFL